MLQKRPYLIRYEYSKNEYCSTWRQLELQKHSARKIYGSVFENIIYRPPDNTPLPACVSAFPGAGCFSVDSHGGRKHVRLFCVKEEPPGGRAAVLRCAVPDREHEDGGGAAPIDNVARGVVLYYDVLEPPALGVRLRELQPRQCVGV